MFYVTCPNCEALIYVPDEAVASHRTGLCYIARCAQCRIEVEADDDTIREVPDAS